jgi:hypothetical protein
MGDSIVCWLSCAKSRSIELDVLHKKMVLCSDVHLAVHCLTLGHAIKRFAIYESASVFQRLTPTSIATRFRRM